MKLWRYVFMVALAVSPAAAQDQVPHDKEQITLTFAPVVKKVAPAVVNIYTRSRVRVADNTSQFMDDPFFRQFFGQQEFTFSGRTHEQVVSSLGSGVIIKPDGLIVTSHHVIKDAQQITVLLSDKREYEAKVVVRDPRVDLAFLRINEPKPLPYLELRDSDSLEVGDLVLAVGNPFGVGQTVTSGIISGLARHANGVSDYSFFIQTDAAINPGNSGGALVDMQGKLIGINTAIYSKSGGSVGIGFAIPSNMVRSLQEGKVEDGRVIHPWLGLALQPVTSEVAESLGLASPRGVLVKQMVAGSAVEKAGLKPGDVITAINGADITSEQDVQYRIALTKVGDTAKFDILRSGKPQTITVPLEAPQEIPKRDLRTIKGRNPLAGLTVANLSPALALELGLPDYVNVNGVIVTSGSSNALGGSALMPGDIVLQVGGTKVDNTATLEKLMKVGSHNWQIIYQRGGNTMTLTVRM